MGTEVATIQPGGALQPHDGMGFRDRLKFAEMLTTTGFLPSAVKSPAQALAIIETGRELGIPPMHALRSIHIIQGKPALSAELQLALFKRRGGRAQWVHSDAERAVVRLQHPNGDVMEETYTLEEARKAGITGKDGWKNYPKAMLRARAISSGLRALAPDIVAGLYDPEELGADVTPSGEIVVPAGSAVVVDEGPTEKQRAFLAKLLQSSVWTDEDRENYRLAAEDATKATMTRLLDDIVEEGKARKARKAEPVEATADA